MPVKHPYIDIPDYQRWSRAIGIPQPADVDPVVCAPFSISPTDRVSTAGSCFAQHIARRLAEAGFSYYVAEPAHPIIPPEMAKEWNYGTFSCRFGNVYTTRQLRQLFDRAYGKFKPQIGSWEKEESFFAPLRPAIQPNGFLSIEELEIDEKQHLSAVRTMFEESDVFVFTLGLTEYWSDRRDGTAYPVCPGVIAGTFDPEIHAFNNQSVFEVIADLSYFIENLRKINNRIKIILTVSPVALAATAENRHVLVSTTYSKSVLRVAADEITKQFSDVTYFPSYEIITGSFNRGAYFSEDRRDVIEDGVDHVMRLFFKYYTPDYTAAINQTSPIDQPATYEERAQKAAAAVCEEKALDAE